ncbi:unnamed protein product, partial [Choristocarpus tenellus]
KAEVQNRQFLLALRTGSLHEFLDPNKQENVRLKSPSLQDQFQGRSEARVRIMGGEKHKPGKNTTGKGISAVSGKSRKNQDTAAPSRLEETLER